MQINYESVIDGLEADICEVLQNKARYYRLFEVPKKSGGRRRLAEPLGVLKKLQKILYQEIFYPKSYLIHPCAYAFVPGRSMKACIEKHQKQPLVVRPDIKDFFGSVTKQSVTDSLLHLFGMEQETAKTIADLCVFQDALPQGAVTSPILSNYVCRRLDRHFSDYCSLHSMEYSRYADDLFFSGDFDPNALIAYAARILRENGGFRINFRKVRVMHQHQRQIVLGVLVNHHCRLTKEKRRMLRQSLYYMNKFGLDDFLGRTGWELNSLRGYVSYASYISGEPFLRELEEVIGAGTRSNPSD